MKTAPNRRELGLCLALLIPAMLFCAAAGLITVAWRRFVAVSLILLIPGILTGLAVLLPGDGAWRRRLFAGLLAAGLVFEIAAGCFILVSMAFTDGSRDVRDYPRALRRSGLARWDFVKLFPDTPAAFPDAEFLYTPQVLQGPEQLCLACTLSPEAEEEQADALATACIRQGTAEELRRSISFRMPNFAAERADESWTVFLFGAEPANAWELNHGMLCMAAMKRGAGRLILVYERW